MSTIKKSRSKILVDDRNGLILAGGHLHAKVAGRHAELTDGAALHETGEVLVDHLDKLASRFESLGGGLGSLLQDAEGSSALSTLLGTSDGAEDAASGISGEAPVVAPPAPPELAEAPPADPEAQAAHAEIDSWFDGDDQSTHAPVAVEATAGQAAEPADGMDWEDAPASDPRPAEGERAEAAVAADWNDDEAPATETDPWADMGDTLDRYGDADAPVPQAAAAVPQGEPEDQWDMDAGEAPVGTLAALDDDEDGAEGEALSIGHEAVLPAAADVQWPEDENWPDTPWPEATEQAAAEMAGDAGDDWMDPAPGKDAADGQEPAASDYPPTPEIGDLIFPVTPEQEADRTEADAEDASSWDAAAFEPPAQDASADAGAPSGWDDPEDWDWARNAPGAEEGDGMPSHGEPQAPLLLTPAQRIDDFDDFADEDAGYTELDAEQARRNGEVAGRVLEIDEIESMPAGVVEEFPTGGGLGWDDEDDAPRPGHEPVDSDAEAVSQIDLSGDNPDHEKIPGDDRGNATDAKSLVAEKGSMMKMFSRKTVAQATSSEDGNEDLSEETVITEETVVAAPQTAPVPKRRSILPILAASVAVIAIGAGAAYVYLPQLGVALPGQTQLASAAPTPTSIPVTTGAPAGALPVPSFPEDAAPALDTPLGAVEALPQVPFDELQIPAVNIDVPSPSATEPVPVEARVLETIPAVDPPREDALEPPLSPEPPVREIHVTVPLQDPNAPAADLDIPLPEPITPAPAQGNDGALDQVTAGLEAAKAGDLGDLMDRTPPPPGSLDATLEGLLSGYARMDALDAKLGGYVTDADLAEVTGKLTDALDRLEGMTQALETRDATIASLQADLTSTTQLAERAEQLSIAQNEVLVKFVRMQEKVDLGEKLIVDLSQRMDVIERIDPADRVAVDRAIADLSDRVETMSRDIGLIARYAINGDTAKVSAPAKAPTTAEGGNAVYVESDAPAKTTKLDRAKVPADVKKGDFVEGGGYVLDVRPTSSGSTLVVMENDSVLIN